MNAPRKCFARSQDSLSHTFWLVPLVFYLLLGLRVNAAAQVVQDATLPNNSVVTPSGSTFEITGGTTAESQEPLLLALMV
jgi:hypothetical protein